MSKLKEEESSIRERARVHYEGQQDEWNRIHRLESNLREKEKEIERLRNTLRHSQSEHTSSHSSDDVLAYLKRQNSKLQDVLTDNGMFCSFESKIKHVLFRCDRGEVTSIVERNHHKNAIGYRKSSVWE